MRTAVVFAAYVLGVAVSAWAATAGAQPFANARNSEAGYLGGERRPATACERLDTSGIADAALRSVAKRSRTVS